MGRRFITSEYIRNLASKDENLELRKSDILTDDARELAKRLGVFLVGKNSRKPIVCGNWKMNGDPGFTMNFFENLVSWTGSKRDIFKKIDIMIAPPHPLLLAALPYVQNSKILLSAQNGFSVPKGAYTGSTSIEMVKNCGAQMVIVAHSERRNIFKEYDELFINKIQTSLKLSMTPIFCVGEKLEERETEKMYDVVSSQILNVFDNIAKDEIGKIIIAYEPVWAIGTGLTASSEDISSMHSFIRDLIMKKYGEQISRNIRIIYGGSVNSKNSFAISKIESVDGVLVGGASLKIEEFKKIICNFEEKTV